MNSHQVVCCESARERLLAHLMMKFTAQRDTILMTALRDRLGDFTIESLRGRLTRVTANSCKTEWWHLDGLLFAEFYEMESEVRGTEYVVSQNYRVCPIGETE